ncbi:MAG: hypothetical protein R3E12_11325 [Candidatus Eisenbacteria bacterium]
MGDLTIELRSGDDCFATSVALDSTSAYDLDLPPQVYYATATVDPATIPEDLLTSDVVRFFERLGAREIDLTAAADTVLDFIYRAPLQVTFTGLEPFLPTCGTLTLEDGTTLPADLPVLEQLEYYDIAIHVSEIYGPDDICPLDSAIVVLYDEINDSAGTPDTVLVKDGEAVYRTFARTPSLLEGRMEGNTNRSFQKLLTAVTIAEGLEPIVTKQWALVLGHVAPPGADFVTVTSNPVPFLVLRDPPGDGSYAYIEENQSFCYTMDFNIRSEEGGAGVESQLKWGSDIGKWAGVGAGVFSSFTFVDVLEESFKVGQRITRDERYQVCMESTERYQTNVLEDGAAGDPESSVDGASDVFIGAGLNFVFSTVYEIGMDGCVVTRDTDAVGFEPTLDGFGTAFSYTGWHIQNVLIPEIDRRIEGIREDGDLSAAEREDLLTTWETRRDVWVDMLADNRSKKLAATVDENRSFSAGADVEFSTTMDSTLTRERQRITFFNEEGFLGSELSSVLEGLRPGRTSPVAGCERPPR